MLELCHSERISTLVNVASSALLVNIRVKLNEQSQACLSFAIASEYLTLVNEDKHGSQNIVSRSFNCKRTI